MCSLPPWLGSVTREILIILNVPTLAVTSNVRHFPSLWLVRDGECCPLIGRQYEVCGGNVCLPLIIGKYWIWMNYKGSQSRAINPRHSEPAQKLRDWETVTVIKVQSFKDLWSGQQFPTSFLSSILEFKLLIVDNENNSHFRSWDNLLWQTLGLMIVMWVKSDLLMTSEKLMWTIRGHQRLWHTSEGNSDTSEVTLTHLRSLWHTQDDVSTAA